MAAANDAPEFEGGIDNVRFEIYKTLITETIGNKDVTITKVTATAAEDDEKNEIEKISVTLSNGESKDIQLTCNICYDDEFAPSQLIEYSFDNKSWYLSSVCETCLNYYRQKKFSNWKEHIEKPVCEASFKRLLKIGVITTMFDHLAFPSPDSEKEQFQVEDDNGKKVPIPRPVSGMRMYDAKNKQYRDVNIHLDGAPENAEAKTKLWNEMIEKFNAKYGKPMIDEWTK